MADWRMPQCEKIRNTSSNTLHFPVRSSLNQLLGGSITDWSSKEQARIHRIRRSQRSPVELGKPLNLGRADFFFRPKNQALTALLYEGYSLEGFFLHGTTEMKYLNSRCKKCHKRSMSIVMNLRNLDAAGKFVTWFLKLSLSFEWIKAGLGENRKSLLKLWKSE